MQITTRPAAINSVHLMMRSATLPLKSWMLRSAGRLDPFKPISLALTHLVEAIRHNHPEILERMGSGKTAIFLIDPVNLPVVFRIQPMTSGIVECRSRSSSCKWDARVAGSLKSLLGMIQGNLDGDALFFSRDISIEGDTEAVLALRNAIDAAEIDLIAEIGNLFGPFRTLVTTSTRVAISVAELMTGKTLLGTN